MSSNSTTRQECFRRYSFVTGKHKLPANELAVAWRLPYGDSGILDFFLGIIARDDLPQKLHVHCLRLIGNSCADTDENRARVVQDSRLEHITRHFSNVRLMPFNVPVTYNILVDYGMPSSAPEIHATRF